MPELHVQRTADALTLSLADQTTSVPWGTLAPLVVDPQRIRREPVAYGSQLFDTLLGDTELGRTVAGLAADQRLLLIVEDQAAARLGWEYLCLPDGSLLAGRVNLVRFVAAVQQRAAPELNRPLQIVAVPVSPVDEERPLQTEEE